MRGTSPLLLGLLLIAVVAVVAVVAIGWKRGSAREPQRSRARLPDPETEARGHDERNPLLLRELESLQVDVTEPREIDVHFWMPAPASAHSLVASFEAAGVHATTVVGDPTPGEALPHSVEMKVKMSPDAIASPSWTRRLVKAAREAGGSYDGWGTPIAPPR